MNMLDDTLLLITADYGMTNITMKCIEDYPKINNCLLRQICMEPRCCSLYIKDECKIEFPNLFSEAFGDEFILYTHDEFVNSKLLGDGSPHIKVKEFIGDYVAVAISEIGLWYKDNKGQYNDFKGGHAELTVNEMLVPLIIVERP